MSKVTYEINLLPLEGRCHLISNGVICRAKRGSWGLCQQHYQKFKARDDGSLEKYSNKPSIEK